MADATSTEPLDRLDMLINEIVNDQATVLQIAAASLAAHQVVDAQYAPQLNPLFRRIWANFLEVQSIATTHAKDILPKDKKSSRRSTGTVGWRANAEVVMNVGLDEMIKRIKEQGQTISRKFLRRKFAWELRLGNIKAIENADDVTKVAGLEVSRLDDFYIEPHNGFRLSTANPLWPTLEGITNSKVFRIIFPESDS